MRYIICIIISCFIYFGASAQGGAPSQTINGWIKNTYTVPDSGTVVSRRDTSWTPTKFGMTITWPRPGVDTTQWIWVGNHWIQDGIRASGDSSFFYIDYIPQVANPSYNEGRLFYDDANKTLTLFDAVSGTSLQIGQEQYVRARNNTGSQINDGTVVYFSGSTGQLPTIALARSDVAVTSRVVGIATHNIGNNTTGKVTTFGLVNDVNTSSFSAGDKLYLSPTTAGALTNTQPDVPNFSVFIGYCINSHPNQGKILIDPQKTLIAVYQLTDTSFIARIDGVSDTIKIKVGSGSGGTVASVGLSMPSAFTVTGSPITSSGTIGVSGAGTSLQYIRGNGTLATFDTTAIPNFYIKVRSLFTPPGSDGQVIFNNAGAFGASNQFTWNNADGILDVTGSGATGNGVMTITNVNGDALFGYAAIQMGSTSPLDQPNFSMANSVGKVFQFVLPFSSGYTLFNITDSLAMSTTHLDVITNRIILRASDSLRVGLGATSAVSDADSVLGVINFQNEGGLKTNKVVKVPSLSIGKNISNASLTANGNYTQNWNHKRLTIDTINALILRGNETDAFLGKKTEYGLLFSPSYLTSPLRLYASLRNTANTSDSLLTELISQSGGQLKISTVNSTKTSSVLMVPNHLQLTGGDSISLKGVAPEATADSVIAVGPYSAASGFRKLIVIPKSSLATTPGGSNTYIQYNNSGAFGGSSFFTWDNSIQTMTVTSDGGEDNAVINVVNGGDQTFMQPYGFAAISTDALHSPNINLVNNLGKQLQIGITGGSGVAFISSTDSMQIASTKQSVSGNVLLILRGLDSVRMDFGLTSKFATADSIVGIVNSLGSGGPGIMANTTRLVKIPYANLYIRDGTLSADRNVASGGFTLRFSGTNNSDTIMSIVNSGTSSVGLYSFGSLYGVDAQGTTIGLRAFGSSIGMTAEGGTSEGAIIKSDAIRGATIQSVPATTNTVQEVVRLERGVNGSPGADGIGGSADFYNKVSDNTSNMSNQIISKFTTATVGTRTSQLSFTGVSSASTNTILTIDGDGSFTTIGKRIMGVTTSSAGTLTLGNSEAYVFNGTTTTWTLPAVSGTTGRIYYIKNIGSGSITLDAAAAANEIYSTSAVNTVTITAGSSLILISNGTYFTTN
jgi:hypothetical protein